MIYPTEKELFYPSALNWMWNYCTWLGKFTDSRGNNYDLGVFIDDDEVSAAIVAGNEPGDYYSGDITNRSEKSKEFDPYEEKYKETYRRAKMNNLIK